MNNKIKVGLKGYTTTKVKENNTAIAYGSGSIDVFATPAMIGLMENAALSSVDTLLEEGYSTVGIKMEVEHLAATPVGLNVYAYSELVEIDNKRLVFEVRAEDEKELIGRGRHERFIVPVDKFVSRARAKIEN